MKIGRLWVLLMLLLVYTGVQAQQLPQSSLFSLNPYLVNPAFSGINDFTDVRLSYRRQWLGLDDAPSTASLTAHLPVGYSQKAIHGIHSPRYAHNQASYNLTPPAGTWRWGAGVQFLGDQTGPTTRNIALATGAAHVSLQNQWQLSAGVGVGALQYTLHFDRIQTANPDPLLPTGNFTRVRPLLTAGMLIRRQNFMAGASVLAPNVPKLDFETSSGSLNNRIVPHYYLTASYRLEVGDEVALLPQVWMKATGHAPVSFDTQLRLQYTDRLWAGVQYRQGESLGMQLGLALSDLLSVGYAYEYPFSLVRLTTTGSHELMLAFRFNNRGYIYSPPMGW
ncbi:PorP/SprF family type IX secretion system membrane protein [Telluribacter humicola]|uniref:PorP/SprF family type IX secretion system membrane protein n=1 Tax=Telluribacter humicola TaxID=1720261 RepID=UPI001A95ADF3|nr:type IX secretion system membrane protein PorP/SprF [Telluribacter humicola]